MVTTATAGVHKNPGQPEGWRRCKPMEWCRGVRLLKLPSAQMAVTFAISTFASAGDGGSCYPGLSRLEWASGASRPTVVSTLQTLESRWLLWCHNRSSGGGMATEYWLTLHDEVEAMGGESYEDWLERCRPNDKRFTGKPSRQAKGLAPTFLGFARGARRVHQQTAQVVTREGPQVFHLIPPTPLTLRRARSCL